MTQVLKNERRKKEKGGRGEGKRRKEGEKGKGILSTENRKDIKMHRDFVKRQES